MPMDEARPGFPHQRNLNSTMPPAITLDSGRDETPYFCQGRGLVDVTLVAHALMCSGGLLWTLDSFLSLTRASFASTADYEPNKTHQLAQPVLRWGANRLKPSSWLRP